MVYSPSVEGSLIILAIIGIILLIFFIMYIIGGMKTNKRTKSVKHSPKTKKQSSKKEFVNNKTRYCIECGFKIVPNAKFCSNCGKQIKT